MSAQFQDAVSQIVHHPEYNSTLILRSETVSDSSTDFPVTVPSFDDLRPQHCTLYAPAQSDDDTPALLVLTPIVEDGSPLPYYHPAVHHLAFRYVTGEIATLRMDIVPLDATPIDLNSRIYRTCLALLDTLHRYGWGAMTNYKKRVRHDYIIAREEYQDLYLVMRERHKHLVQEWQEVTDPLKHVFEDIGIATFLMLLWKHSYVKSGPATNDTEDLNEAPWRNWARPPAGFLDLGCGNGLLTHILTAEGYSGYGIDVRARTSWSHYPESTQAQLRVEALDPTSPVLSPDDTSYLCPGTFIIANHADELTPWTPVLATLHSASGYLSIPCCAWSFDERFERSKAQGYPVPDDAFIDSLSLGGDGSHSSSYSTYRIWLASLSLQCGWNVECENLRIPSTRNWAIVGRERVTTDAQELEDIRSRVEEIVTRVRERGLFKTRTPEGKAKDH
ncbi:DUF1613-domain-containing protein [Epithele typhae]|uniref:DUF1613-domain-containing protein n=1 Tax=Epithele typhae TaxID=378194 RepID=UPI002007A649|nr:DUF1613-domain-containing protein [Epithele typhae]KAH9944086.1 DUF1613-domain-containing protein [Epithele typhae]